jgi:prolyl-tRNA synthetase
MKQEKNSSENKAITPRSEDYSKWYQDIIDVAELAEHGPSRGSMVIRPYGYALWETIQKYLDEKFKETGVSNAYFPLLIPERLLKREESHIEGFSPEVAVVTHAGGSKLDEPLIIRPTSETIMYEVFSGWIHSYRDLPLLINQWANVVRWEMRPRLFLRTTEFLWQEGHTAHATLEEADSRARQMLGVYEDFARDVMAIPVIPGEKSENERFAGALRTYAVEAMMQDGKALQFATSHNLGQNFSKAFDISFTNENGETAFVWQTSWGLSTRTIGGLIMVHSDDKGLVLPPLMASVQIVIIPIWKDEESKGKVLNHCNELLSKLKITYGSKVILDERDVRAGEKHYHWEKRGVPVRIEVGPRDIEKNEIVLVRRDTSEKTTIKNNKLDLISELLKDIHSSLYSKALKFQKEKTKEVDTWDDFIKEIEAGNFVSAHWCGDKEVEQKIKEETKATIRVIPFNQPEEKGHCVYSKKPSKGRVIFARGY